MEGIPRLVGFKVVLFVSSMQCVSVSYRISNMSRFYTEKSLCLTLKGESTFLSGFSQPWNQKVQKDRLTKS